MAGNTKTTTTILNSYRRVIVYFTLKSDGTQETNAVVYDSSAQATAQGGVTDPLKCKIRKVWMTCSGAAVVAKLNWDATTPVVAVALPYQNSELYHDFTCFDGLINQGGSGITGDITLTTTGLASGDSLTIVLEVDPQWAEYVA